MTARRPVVLSHKQASMLLSSFETVGWGHVVWDGHVSEAKNRAIEDFFWDRGYGDVDNFARSIRIHVPRRPARRGRGR